MKITRKVLPSIVFGALLVSAVSAMAQTTTPTPNVPLQKTIGQVSNPDPVPSLFVLNSDGATLKDGKLVLTGVDKNTIVFADRPVRAAGHVMTAQAIQQWDKDKDNFINDPPNGTISVLGGDGSDVDDAVVVLSNPVLDGTTLTFDVTVLEGAITKSGPAALFIDRGGFGGFHGGGDFRGGNFNDVHVNSFHGGSYWHAPVYHGAWYRGAGAVAAGAVTGAVVGSAIANNRDYYNGYGAYGGGYAYPPYCGYYPYPPCY